MEAKWIPGTVMPYADVQGSAFALFRPMIRAADGLTLGQVSAITGLEYSTVQNWVKRGFVAHPVRKKYYDRHLARILLISVMRDCMKIEEIGELLGMVNGDATDESDDIISEMQLYDDLCEVIRVTDLGASTEEIRRAVGVVTADYVGPTAGARRRLTLALMTMACAYTASRYKTEADLFFRQLKAGGVS